jgi:hypothetical protein
MFEALKTFGIIWAAMLLTYGSIAFLVIAARWSVGELVGVARAFRMVAQGK